MTVMRFIATLSIAGLTSAVSPYGTCFCFLAQSDWLKHLDVSQELQRHRGKFGGMNGPPY